MMREPVVDVDAAPWDHWQTAVREYRRSLRELNQISDKLVNAEQLHAAACAELRDAAVELEIVLGKPIPMIGGPLRVDR